ncbi:Mobile element protein [Streptococcus dysgalactiae subsp. dysgalactiae]|uniref:Mobile element protein n=1 Tax=Streptococcus dysgalactiae subsp. dysgalactiae TaxID=99822 RepID=A0A380JYK0_STRDY|nr:Mobile element protein [Streptococcus dysgalactiae subsp. dysgalactiae]
MCRWLNIPRSSYYYKAVEPVSEVEIEEMITCIFLESKSRYGARKIKKCLENDAISLSRRRIRRIIERLNLVSVYQKVAFKPLSKGKNDAPIPNYLHRQFNQERSLEATVTDLTYIRVGKCWAYVCLIIDLFNKEFDNQLIDEMLEAFGIIRSLSQAGCPYDNVVAESTYRSFKLEFVNQETFHSLEELILKTKDYVYWWNHYRTHGSLNYQTPMAKRLAA